MVSIYHDHCHGRCFGLLGLKLLHIAFVLVVVSVCIPKLTWGQVPSTPQAPVPGLERAQRPSIVQQKPHQSQEYAFRPDLTNPEFGECLQLEKNWKVLWGRYTQMYEQTRWMHPSNSQYIQTTYYLQQLKMQLDAAWNTFSSRCIYFPTR
jgi:hypothetical protein